MQEVSPFEEKKTVESMTPVQNQKTAKKQENSDDEDLGIPAFIRRKMM